LFVVKKTQEFGAKPLTAFPRFIDFE